MHLVLWVVVKDLPAWPDAWILLSIATRAGITPATFIPSWFSGQKMVRFVTRTAALMPMALLIGSSDTCREFPPDLQETALMGASEGSNSKEIVLPRRINGLEGIPAHRLP